MKKNIVFISIVEVFIFIFFIVCKLETKWSGKVIRENEMQIIENKNKPIYDKDIFTLEEIFDIKSKNISQKLFINVMSSVAADWNGNIYILDTKSRKIFSFDSKGKFIREFGRKGEGPGEFQSPFSMGIIADEEIFVHDITNNRLSFFALNGSLSKEISTAREISVMNIKCDSNRNIYASSVLWGPEITIQLKKYDKFFNEKFTIVEFKYKISKDVRKLFQAPQLYFNIINNDNIIWANYLKYQFIVINNKGNEIKKIEKEYEPVKITNEDKEREIEKNRYSKGTKVNFPDCYPPFQYFIIDEIGRIYVKIFEKVKDNRFKYEIFDSKGRYLARTILKVNPQYIKDNRMYCIVEDENGLNCLKVFRISWNQ